MHSKREIESASEPSRGSWEYFTEIRDRIVNEPKQKASELQNKHA